MIVQIHIWKLRTKVASTAEPPLAIDITTPLLICIERGRRDEHDKANPKGIWTRTLLHKGFVGAAQDHL